VVENCSLPNASSRSPIDPVEVAAPVTSMSRMWTAATEPART